MARGIVAGIAGLALVGGLAVWAVDGDDYTVRAVLPNANNLFVGSSVMQDGYKAGSVKSIEVKDGKALVELSVDDDFGPLHDGATVEVVWKAALGERLVRIVDGDERSPELPDGALLSGVQREPIELDAVLSSLDAPTRKHLASLVSQLEGTLAGREQDANASLEAAGPALRELGAVLREVGTDGQAIEQIGRQFNETLEILASRSDKIDGIVRSLAATTDTVARQEDELGTTLERLPPVLRSATRTLGRVPETVDVSLPMLEELAPATANLRPVAANLRPLLRDLRPTVADLVPTLESLSELLGLTPDLLDVGTATVPDADNALQQLTPALDFLRPYTPELVGWASQWGAAGGNYDRNGKYVRFHIMAGAESVVPALGPGPGVTQNLTPAPGSPVGQPWTDAYGSEMR